MRYEVIIENGDNKNTVSLPGMKYVNRYIEKIKSLNKFNNNYNISIIEVNIE